MKKIFVIALVLSIYTVMPSNAQTVINSRTNLKGPKAKNHKVWNNNHEDQTNIVGLQSDLKGPQAKNTKIQDRKVVNQSIQSKGGDRLKGPRAKNQRP